MKPPFLLLGVIALFCSMVLSELKATTIDLPLYGFQIDALDASPGSSSAAPLIMALPVSDGLAPSVSIQIQLYNSPIKDYVVLSKAQFDQMQWKIISERINGDNEWSVEYTGPMQGNNLHFYARAISKDNRVYLVTATSKESQWASIGDQLRKNVDSFKLK